MKKVETSYFAQLFNRAYEWDEFPLFVPKEERDYNKEWAQRLIEDKIVYGRWREDVERGGWKRFDPQATRIAAHGGAILEICCGPGGGFAPAVLMKDYNAHICLSDLCPTVLREWKKLFDGMDNPPPNMEYAALDVCALPFADCRCDAVICTVDLMKRDSEIKLRIGCTADEKAVALRFHNDSEYMKGIMVRRDAL